MNVRYSNLTYDDYYDNIDFWKGTEKIELPNWADEIAEYGESVSATDFYSDIFGDGDLEPCRKGKPEDYRTGEYGAIAVEIKDKGKNRYTRRITVTDGGEELIELIDSSKNFCMVAPVSYAGKRRTNKNARFLHALCIEIDDIQPKRGIIELFYKFERKVNPIPRPTYIVCSGNGLHLYWQFVRPIPLFGNIFKQFTALKQRMTWELWQKSVSSSWQHIQYESLCQAFRCVGTRGKDKHKVAMCFKVGEPLTIEQFNERVPLEKLKINVIYKSNLTLAEAKEQYPKWYQRRIVEKKPKGHYYRNEAIYKNWIEKIWDGAEEGHRYNCLENLCSLAVQCKIPPDVVEADCRRIALRLEEKTTKPDNHFGEYDIMCALRTYHNADESAFHRKIECIEVKSGIKIERAKRNGRTQKEHCQIMRAIEEITTPDWREGNGRKSKKDLVQQWRKENPNGKKIDCERELKLSRHTVLKWWDE